MFLRMLACLAAFVSNKHGIVFHGTTLAGSLKRSRSVLRSSRRLLSTRSTRSQHTFAGMTAVTTDGNNNFDVQLMQDILYRVRAVNYLPEDVKDKLVSFELDGTALGKVNPSIAQMLCSTLSNAGRRVFTFATKKNGQNVLTLAPESAGHSFASRSAAVSNVMEKLRDDGLIHGWRGEAYPVSTSFYEEPFFVMERAAVPFLGVLEYGVHVNGLIHTPNEGTRMWMARRSRNKSKYPGMLDHIVAGGQPAGLSLMDNVIKECMEEAGIPQELVVAGIRPAGAISYETYSERSGTVSRAVLFNYDLYLPSSFQPKPVDGEVDEFFLWTVDDILASMAPSYHDPIKPNCYSVIIDYLLRAGHLSPDVPGYLDVLRELRSGDCR